MLQCDYCITSVQLTLGDEMSADIFPEKNNIESLLNEGKTLQLKPLGFSMYPLIVPERDEVIVAPIRGHKIKRGDILLYRRINSKLIIHRVVKSRDNSLYMCGDNEDFVEGPVSKDQVFGILTGFIRKGKKHSISNPLYFLYWNIWLILLPFRKPISKFIHSIKKVRK